jgi:hypothetical protein
MMFSPRRARACPASLIDRPVVVNKGWLKARLSGAIWRPAAIAIKEPVTARVESGNLRARVNVCNTHDR